MALEPLKTIRQVTIHHFCLWGKTTLEEFGFLFCLGPLGTAKCVVPSALTGAHSFKPSPGSPNGNFFLEKNTCLF